MQQIIVTVKADGATEVSVQGVKGQGCDALTKALEASLGTAETKKRTGDFYVQQAHSQHQK
jgi:Protein of unknown function (DUF2997)